MHGKRLLELEDTRRLVLLHNAGLPHRVDVVLEAAVPDGRLRTGELKERVVHRLARERRKHVLDGHDRDVAGSQAGPELGAHHVIEIRRDLGAACEIHALETDPGVGLGRPHREGRGPSQVHARTLKRDLPGQGALPGLSHGAFPGAGARPRLSPSSVRRRRNSSGRRGMSAHALRIGP